MVSKSLTCFIYQKKKKSINLFWPKEKKRKNEKICFFYTQVPSNVSCLFLIIDGFLIDLIPGW